jgi:exodeoxyribonuclease X
MKIRVVDFETTGLPEDAVKAICEVGYTDVFPVGNAQPSMFEEPRGQLAETVSFLVNPGHSIPPVTRAIHHISDADVADAMKPSEAMKLLMQDMNPGDMFAAHNTVFEQAFFGGGDYPWICTFKCAQHLFPEAPRHANQVLRYWLDVDGQPNFDPALAMPPHRAGPDTYVTAFILLELLKKSSAEELVRLTTAPVLLETVTFGKHRGAKWRDLPPGYLSWIVNVSDLGEDEKHTAQHYLSAQ